MDFILLAGLWLDGSAWTDVGAELERLGHRAVAVNLPGQGDGSRTATLDDQLAAVLAAVDTANNPVVVGHSAACTLAWLAADRRATAVRRVVLIGGFPSGNGDTYFDGFAPVNGVLPFPGWDAFDGPDSADVDDATRQRIAANAIPVPETVTTSTITLSDERRFHVPVTLICPEFGPEQAKSWINSGDVPEVAAARDVSFVDIDSGHWPMFTRPTELATLLDKVSCESRPR